MDKIHVDYCAQTSRKQMRIGNSSSTKQLCRGKPSDVSIKLKGSITKPPPVHGKINLPPNIGNLIPNDYYQQFKGWYEASCLPERERSDEQKKFLSSFKWRHTMDPNVKRPWTAPSRPRADQRCIYDDHCLRRDRGQNKWSRSPSSDS